VRIPLFDRLFSRKSQETSPANGTRLRSGNGGSPQKPRFPVAGIDGEDASRRAPTLAVDTTTVVGGGERLPPPEKAAMSVMPVKSAMGRSSLEEEPVKTTKMAPQEELSIKISEGLKSLSTVLGAIDEKLAAQSRTAEMVADRLQALPRVLEGLVDAERNNLETMQALRTSLEKQGEAARGTSERLDKLPGVVEGLGTRIVQQTEASAAVKTSVESIGQSVRGLVDGAQRSQNSLITEFRRGQDEQRQKLEGLIERQRRTTQLIFGVLIAVFVGLVWVLAKMPR
jgi:septation ring formation regulator EzrA